PGGRPAGEGRSTPARPGREAGAARPRPDRGALRRGGRGADPGAAGESRGAGADAADLAAGGRVAVAARHPGTDTRDAGGLAAGDLEDELGDARDPGPAVVVDP